MLSTSHISYRIGKKKILNDISAEFLPGEFNMVLGPNGSGKSSFLKIFSGEIRGFEGTVMYDHKKLYSFKKEELAKRRAVMSQQPDLHFPLTVEEVVMMGRYPHFIFNPGKKDRMICQQVIGRMDLTAFRERNYLTLSGGEKQRVQFARVLAQVWEPPDSGLSYLFLDEPLASLDINYQQEFLQIAREFAGPGTVLIAVMHDINLAAHYGDKLFFLKNGELAEQGRPADILNAELIERIFGVKVSVIRNPVTNDPLMIYQ